MLLSVLLRGFSVGIVASTVTVGRENFAEENFTRENFAEENFAISFESKHFAVLISRFVL